MGNVAKLLVNSFKWIKKLAKFKEDFIRNYEENSNKGYILERDVKYPIYSIFTKILHF